MSGFPLVIGGAGFIGSALVRSLTLDNERVVVIDPRYRDHALYQGAGEIKHLHASVEQVSARNVQVIGGKPDIIYCLAAPVGTAGILGRQVARECVSAACASIDLANEFGCPLVMFSSSEVMGATDDYDESASAVIGPDRCSARAGYGIGKLAVESIAGQYADDGLVATIRPFNTAGPGQSGALGFVLPRLSRQALAGEPLTVFGDGMQRRAFMHVDDLVRFVIDFLPQRKSLFDGVPIAVGAPENETTIRNLAWLVLKHAGKREAADRQALRSRAIEFTDGQSEFGRDFAESPAATKLPTSFGRAFRSGWAPRNSLDSIVRDVVEYEHMQMKQAP